MGGEKYGVVRKPLESAASTDLFSGRFRHCFDLEPDLAVRLSTAPAIVPMPKSERTTPHRSSMQSEPGILV